jgi:hypothetical protein
MTVQPSVAVKYPIYWPHLACAAFVVLWLDVGVADSLVSSLPSIVKVAVLGLWLLIAAARSLPLLGTLVVSAWPLGLMLLVSVVYAAEIAQSGQYTQGFAYLLIAFTLARFYSQPHLRRERLALMWVIITDFVITGLRTVVALQSDPQLSRYLATTQDNRTAVYGDRSFAGLGGYGFAYSLAAILVVLLYFLVRSRVKTPFVIVTAAGLLVLVELAFTTAIVLVLVLGGGFLVHDLVRRADLRIFLYSAALVGWASGLYSTTLAAVAHISWVNQDVGQRLIELSQFLSGESSTGSDLATRFDRWASSIEMFLSSGPFGLAGQGRPNQATGGHSQWLDMLASYGLWIGGLALFLVFAWRLLGSRMPPNGVAALRRSWVFFLVLGLVNTLLFSTIVLTWMFLLPSLAGWLAERTPSSPTTVLKAVPT